MRIQTGFKIIVWVEPSCRLTKLSSHVRNKLVRQERARRTSGTSSSHVRNKLVARQEQARRTSGTSSCETTGSLARAARLYYKLSIRALAMAGGWTAQMTRTLVSVWGQANVQSELDGVVRNRTICERICVTERGSIVKRR